MMKTITAQFLFENNKKVVEGLKDEIPKKIQTTFGVSPSECELRECSKRGKFTITLSELKPGKVYSIEMTRKPVKIADVVRKIETCELFTSAEKDLCIQALESNSSKKRKSDSTQYANKRVQVFPRRLIDHMDATTQTDKEIRQEASSKETPIKEIIRKGRVLATAEKVDLGKSKQNLDRTYNDRRNFIINDNPSIRLIREHYPLLFSLAEVRNEIDRIFVTGRCHEFMRNISIYSKCILSTPNESDPLLEKIKNKMHVCKSHSSQMYAQDVGSILMLSALVREKLDYLVLEDTPDFAESKYPVIVAKTSLNGLFSDRHDFKIFVENILVCEATNFLEAVLCLMGVYFIFNINYDESNRETLVIMERIYLEAKDTEDIDSSIEQIIRTLELKNQTGYYK